ncbi:MAG: hypothetical protein ABI678_07955 [Kofleriaceae bacterium]
MDRKPGLLLVYQRRLCPIPFDQLVGKLMNVEIARAPGGWLVTRDGAEVHLSHQVGPDSVNQAIGLLGRASSIDPAIAQRCDAVIVASWRPDHDVAEITLEISYLEETVKGVTIFLVAQSISEGSFPAHAGEPVLGGTFDPARLIGTWMLDPAEPCAVAPPGELQATITRNEFVYSSFQQGGVQRIQLTYRVDGGDVITDQPSAPKEQRSPISFGEDGRLFLRDLGGPTIFVRTDEARDPDAAMSALAGFALHHGIGSAGAGEPIIPFVVIEEADGTRKLVRFVTDAAGARAAAEAQLASSDAAMYAFALDGYLTVDGQKTDAIIVEASRVGRDRALVFAQPYAVRGDAAVATGPQHASGDAESWL